MSIEQSRARFERVKFAQFLGVRVIHIAEARAVLEMPYHAAHMNVAGPLNGGASASLLNMAGSVAAWTGIHLDKASYLSCVDMTVQYLSAAFEEDVIAEAHVLRRGRDLFFLEVAVQTPEGKPICQGLMMYRGPDYAGHAPRLRAQPDRLALPNPLRPPAQAWLIDGYTKKIGVTVPHYAPGRVRLQMPCTAMHMDASGHMHEGALASIIDIAGTSAAWSLVPNREGARGSTVGMQVSYTSKTCEPVVADAHVQQRSEELFFSAVQVTTATTGHLVAMGQVSYRLLEPRADALHG